MRCEKLILLQLLLAKLSKKHHDFYYLCLSIRAASVSCAKDARQCSDATQEQLRLLIANVMDRLKTSFRSDFDIFRQLPAFQYTF